MTCCQLNYLIVGCFLGNANINMSYCVGMDSSGQLVVFHSSSEQSPNMERYENRPEWMCTHPSSYCSIQIFLLATDLIFGMAEDLI